MKQFSLDFKDSILGIKTDKQDTTEKIFGLKKEDFESFIPEKYKDRMSFTWDFEAETISINEVYKPSNTNNGWNLRFIPEVVEPMPNLGKRFDEFAKTVKLEEWNIGDEIRKVSPELAELIGL